MNRFYVSKPYIIGLDKLGLKYVDLLTYVAVKSFRNHQENSCFPAYQTIGELMGASRSFVVNSVSRLEKAGLVVKHTRYHNSNRYYFKAGDIPTKIPVQILKLDLSIYEKAMLIVMRQFSTGAPHLVDKDISYMANQLGVSYKTVYTQVQALINKGYVIAKQYKKRTRYELTDLFDWYFEWDMPTAQKPSFEDFSLILG